MGYSRKLSIDNEKPRIVDPLDEQTINAVAPTKKGKRFSAPIISKRTKLYNGINQIGSFGVRIADDDSDALCIQDVQSFGISAINYNSNKPFINAPISDNQEDNKLRFISADDRSLAISGDTEMNTWDQRKTRRRLNWRIGPLKKKQRSKKVNIATSCKSVVSTSEKTAKSSHTMHSVETARIRNSDISSSGRRKFLLSSQDRKPERKASSRLSTIGEYGNGDDNGSVVLALNEEEAFDPNTNQYRTIDLFHKTEKFDKSNLDQCSPINHSHLPPRNSPRRGSSSIAYSLSEIEHYSWEDLNLAHLQAISEGCTTTNESSSSKFTKGGISTNAVSKDFPKTPLHSSKKVLHSNAPSPVHTPSTAASDSSSHGDETSTDVQKIQSELNLKAMHHLAIQHLNHNEYKQSVEVLTEMLRGVLAIYGSSHTRVGTVHHNIATIYMRMGEFRKVVFHAQCAIRIRRSNILHTSVSLSDLAVSYTQLGLALLELDEHELSLNMLHKALAIQNKICSGSAIMKCSRLLNNIGCCLFKLNRWDEANIAFRDALEIQRRLLNSRDNSAQDGNNEYTKEMDRKLLGIASTLSNLASICVQKDKCNDAYTYLEEALLLQQSVLGDMHNVSTSTKRSLDILQNKMDSSNNGQSNYARNCAKDKGHVWSNTQDIFNAPMKFRNPLESLSDIQSELSLIFDDMLSSQKTCFQCVTKDIPHDKGDLKENSSHLNWI